MESPSLMNFDLEKESLEPPNSFLSLPSNQVWMQALFASSSLSLVSSDEFSVISVKELMNLSTVTYIRTIPFPFYDLSSFMEFDKDFPHLRIFVTNIFHTTHLVLPYGLSY